MVRQARDHFLIQEDEDGWPSPEIEKAAYQTFYQREAHRMALETVMVLHTVWTRLYGPASDFDDSDKEWSHGGDTSWSTRALRAASGSPRGDR